MKGRPVDFRFNSRRSIPDPERFPACSPSRQHSVTGGRPRTWPDVSKRFTADSRPGPWWRVTTPKASAVRPFGLDNLGHTDVFGGHGSGDITQHARAVAYHNPHVPRAYGFPDGSGGRGRSASTKPVLSGVSS